LAESLPDATFLPALRRANVMGALDMGLGPKLRPGRAYAAGEESRDTLTQLAALRAGEQKAVLLLGDLLGNVLDAEGATAALEAAQVVVVTGHGGATLAYADVVLPAAVQHERLGTVTNIEGRVTAVTAKIVAPGSAWPDVAIAAELAEQCGQSLGLTSVEEAAKVLEATTGYPALSVLNDVTDEGAVVGRGGERTERRALDPMAFPGIKSTNTVGLAELSGAVLEPSVVASPAPAPAALAVVAAGRSVDVPHYDAYAVSLLVSRRLYDHGVAVQGSPALANLVATTTAYLNHFDLDRLGLVTGDHVNVMGATSTHTLPVVLNDQTPRGVLEVTFGALDDDGGTATTRALVDPGSVITQVRLATS
jgi:NADH-quinone oxidoreductase subunit G